jgi:hypothetical protein
MVCQCGGVREAPWVQTCATSMAERAQTRGGIRGHNLGEKAKKLRRLIL